MKTTLLFGIMLIPCLLCSQSIKGRVIDADTKEPLVLASVYYNSTSIGTSTDTEGNFEIAYSNSYPELVVSYVGFETIVFPIDSALRNNIIRFELSPLQLGINEIEITDTRGAQWFKNFKFFKNAIIGTSSLADQTTIKNEKAVYFAYDSSNYTLSAYSKEPLVVINQALGYKIEYQLVDFKHDEDQAEITYLGYPRFIELDGSPAQRNRWKRNRRKAYLGSFLHFSRVLYADSLQQSGFIVGPIINHMMLDDLDVICRPAKYDYRKYIHRSENTLSFDFDGDLQVAYTKERQDKKYIRNIEPIILDKKKFQFSNIIMVEAATINASGAITNPLAIFLQGYWAFEKLGEALPYDYKLD